MSNTKTKEIIKEMLLECTGISILDSGGEFGRHWQLNQLRNFDDPPSASVNFKHGYIEYTKNVYTFLCDCLDFDEEMNTKFETFCEEKELDLVIDSVDEFLKQFEDVCGIYGDSSGPVTDNTYNNENVLDQDLLYTFARFNEEKYLFLQIHNGADVRGGYTDVKVFTTDEDDFFGYNNGHIFCENEHSWYTDDGHHWYPSNNEKENLEKLYEKWKLDKRNKHFKCPLCKSKLKAC